MFYFWSQVRIKISFEKQLKIFWFILCYGLLSHCHYEQKKKTLIWTLGNLLTFMYNIFVQYWDIFHVHLKIMCIALVGRGFSSLTLSQLYWLCLDLLKHYSFFLCIVLTINSGVWIYSITILKNCIYDKHKFIHVYISLYFTYLKYILICAYYFWIVLCFPVFLITKYSSIF